MTPPQPNDLAAKLHAIDSHRMIRVLALLLAFAGAILLAAFCAYFQEFHGGFSPKQEIWGQFGDFVGGTVNPILSFLTLIALVLTVVLQIRQLDLAREELNNSKAELESTRKELERSADTQRITARALEEQAKHAVIAAQLAALRASLEITSESFRQAQNAGVLAGPDTYQQLLQRKEAITSEILRITDQLCSKS